VIRFYLLHVMVLPLLMAVFLAVHFWRIRKDGGITRPNAAGDPTTNARNRAGAANDDGRVGTPETRPSRTYGLMAVVRGKTPAVDRSMADTVPTWPNALYAVAALTMLTLAVMLALGYY
jgi:quinol-cytochrome oxidoreductase complex cytochrome b subunit